MKTMIAPTDYISRIQELNLELQEKDHCYAQFWAYTVSHKELIIRLSPTVLGVELKENRFIVCIATYEIHGKTFWEDCCLRIAFIGKESAILSLADERAGIQVLCASIEIFSSEKLLIPTWIR